MKNKRYAFTMIEVIFVIVMLGILAAIAIPKFAATRTDAVIAKGKSDIASIRSGIISERQSRLIQGQSFFITPENLNRGGLFGGVLTYPMKDSTDDGHWHKEDDTTYTFKVGEHTCTFIYDQITGRFDLSNTDDKICNKLVQ